MRLNSFLVILFCCRFAYTSYGQVPCDSADCNATTSSLSKRGSIRIIRPTRPPRRIEIRPKLEYGPIQTAWNEYRGVQLGSGEFGTVYELKTKFMGEKAVIKEIVVNTLGEHMLARYEAMNLQAVDQLLGWARYMKNRDPNARMFQARFYIVMEYMGMSKEAAIAAGLDPGHIPTLQMLAKARYRRDFHMINMDANDNNFRYHYSQRGWRAEIIDWAYARRVDHPAADKFEEFVI